MHFPPSQLNITINTSDIVATESRWYMRSPLNCNKGEDRRKI
jgi:hypothetical protein